MKIFYFLFMLFYLISYNGIAQNPYYDAINIRNVIENDTLTKESVPQFISILKKYLPDVIRNIPDNSIITAIYNKDSKFHNPYFEDIIKDDSKIHSANIVKTQGLSSIVSGISGINVTNFADALTQFLLDRATQEINVAFFGRFKKFLEKYPEAGILFPITTDYIGNFSPHEYTTFLSTLREAFYGDLKKLIYNVDDIFLLPKYATLIDDFPEIIISVNCIQLIIDLEEGIHPVDVIANFKNLSVWEDFRNSIDTKKKYALRNLHNGLKTSHLFSNSLRVATDTIKIDTIKALVPIKIDSISCLINGEKLPSETINIGYDSLYRYHILSDMDTLVINKIRTPEIDCDRLKFTESLADSTVLDRINSKAWISIQDFRKNILEDEVTFQIFLGLIYQQAKTENVYFIANTAGDNSQIDSTYLHNFLSENKSKSIIFKSLFLELLQKGKTVDLALRDIKIKKTSNSQITREDYYKYINSSIDVIEYGFKLANYIHEDISADEYLKIARNGNDLYKNTYEKKYAAAIMNAATIFDLTFTQIQKEQPKGKLKKMKEGVEKQNFKSTNEALKIIPDILRYGTFIANIVESEDAAQVKTAIEAAVLPVGSSSVKKYYSNNWSLNAYLGGFFRTKSTEVQQTWDSRFGFIAPVGIAYTPISLGRGGSFSLFGSLIDVGSIAQFRISDSGTEIKEEISLGNIFSPGAYVIYGMALDMPLSIGFGTQYGPGLVSFTVKDNAAIPEVGIPSWRWNIFLAVDIPLINLKKGKSRKLTKK